MVEREAVATGAVVLRLARPPVNALDVELVQALTSAVAKAVDDRAPALVITGAGRAFSAGIDTKVAAAAGAAERAEGGRAINAMVSAIYGAPIPIVAAVNGHAIGGGLVLALACDIRVGCEGDYQLALNEAAAGVPFPAGPLRVVQAALDPSVANDLCLTSRRVGPAAALELRVLDELVEPERLAARALELAEGMASFPAYATVKAQLREEITAQLEEMARQS